MDEEEQTIVTITNESGDVTVYALEDDGDAYEFLAAYARARLDETDPDQAPYVDSSNDTEVIDAYFNDDGNDELYTIAKLQAPRVRFADHIVVMSKNLGKEVLYSAGDLVRENLYNACTFPQFIRWLRNQPPAATCSGADVVSSWIGAYIKSVIGASLGSMVKWRYSSVYFEVGEDFTVSLTVGRAFNNYMALEREYGPGVKAADAVSYASAVMELRTV